MRAPSLIAVFCATVLAACDPLYVGSAATVVTTDKTVTDHIFSIASGKDCSTVRLDRGRTFCREDEPNPEPKVTCFQTLAGVDCYRDPVDPYDPRKERVGRNEHNTIGR